MDIPCINPCVQCAPGIGGGIGPIDPDNPFVNLSSEAPDSVEYIGRNWTYWDPPLGSNWNANGCLGLCISTVSQADANLCALQQAVFCISNEQPEPCPTCVPTPNDPFPEQPRTLFTNTPQSCVFTCPDGTPFTFTVAAGLFSNFSQLAANIEAQSYACNQVTLRRVCLGSLSPARTCSNALYVGTITCSSANIPISFTTIGEIPDGLLMVQNETQAFFSGSPTIPGDYSWTVVATDQFGNTAQKAVTLTIFGVATVALPDGEVGTPYSATLVSGGTPAGTVLWSITEGTLPDGLALNSVTGEIFGTPTTEETQTIQVTVTDGTLTCNKSMGIQVAEPISFPNFIFQGLAGNSDALSSAFINSYNFLTPGVPADGDPLTNSVITAWTVIPPDPMHAGYAIVFDGNAVATAADVGNYQVTIDSINVTPFTLNPGSATVFLNGVPQLVYDLNTTTGPQSVIVPVADGDTLTVQLAVDGQLAPNDSYQVSMTAIPI